MNFSKQFYGILFLIACVVTMMTGCQTIRNNNAVAKEQMLAAAGFQMKLAQTPEQLANVQALPQRKLIPHTKDGQVMYVYADATICQCIYVGTENNYQQYQKMAFEQDLADEQEMTAEVDNEASLNWGAWGPWGPWRY